jgi:hypothetical protein
VRGWPFDAMGNAASRISQSMASNGSSNLYFNDSNSTTSGYMSEKLKGNS